MTIPLINKEVFNSDDGVAVDVVKMLPIDEGFVILHKT